MNILQDARRRIIKRSVEMIEIPPEDFSTPYNLKTGLMGGGALGTAGVMFGSHAGLALFGTAISGAWVLAPILGIAGLAIGAYSSNDT